MDQEAKKTCNDCIHYMQGLCNNFHMAEGSTKEVFSSTLACDEFTSKWQIKDNRRKVALTNAQRDLGCNLYIMLEEGCDLFEIMGIVVMELKRATDLVKDEQEWEKIEEERLIKCMKYEEAWMDAQEASEK